MLSQKYAKTEIFSEEVGMAHSPVSFIVPIYGRSKTFIRFLIKWMEVAEHHHYLSLLRINILFDYNIN